MTNIRNNHGGCISFGIRRKVERKNRLVHNLEVKVKPGDNVVDDAVWSTVASQTDDAWLADMTTPKGKKRAVLEIDQYNAPAPVKDVPPEPPEPEYMSAAKKVALIKKAQTVDEIRALIEGDDRKTVNDAAEKRWDELTDDD